MTATRAWRPSIGKQLGAFVRLSRFPFLVGGFIGGALGTAIAAFEGHAVDVLAYVLAQLTITGAHLMTQYANEFFDRESDALTTRTLFSGGSGALVDGSLAPHVALVAALTCMAASCTGAVVLAVTGHRLAAFLGVACIVLAWAYSAPPLRLLARGLGELDTALVVAVLVPLCAYAAQTGAVDPLALSATLPGAATMFAMMICVEMPDLAADSATGKRNLVVRFGFRAAALLGISSLVLAIFGFALISLGGAPRSFIVAELFGAIAIVWLGSGLAALRNAAFAQAASLAGRGVYVFAIVGVCSVLGFAIAAGTRQP